jgi:hypothetical protein
VDPRDKIPGGSMTLFEVAEVAKQNGKKIVVPPTLIVGSAEKELDKRIWTDPSTGTIRVLNGLMVPTDI